jgi:hypothetical protein
MVQIAGVLNRACEALAAAQLPSAAAGTIEAGHLRPPAARIAAPVFAFGIGSFQIDAAEQRAMRDEVALKKIYRVQQVFQRVIELGKIHRFPSPDINYRGLEAVVDRLRRQLKRTDT